MKTMLRLDDCQKKRFIQQLLVLLGVLFAGFGYYFFVTVTGFKMLCGFNELTGLLCPGCGLTRMCISIIELDFYSAFGYNKLIFVTLPVLALIFFNFEYNYIKTGEAKLNKPVQWIGYLELALLLVFGVVRNII